tara:strand:- start:76 stop:237 length:162 start_codon:yes stop_codon:yes gene_type:complete
MLMLCKDMGVLPVAGGLLDQNPAIVELFSVLASAQNERQELEQKKAESKANRR